MPCRVCRAVSQPVPSIVGNPPLPPVETAELQQQHITQLLFIIIDLTSHHGGGRGPREGRADGSQRLHGVFHLPELHRQRGPRTGKLNSITIKIKIEHAVVVNHVASCQLLNF